MITAKLFGLVAVIAPLISGVYSAAVCDRQCLLQILTIYADGLSQKNVSAIPVDPKVRVTNNGNVTTLGNGLVWHTPGSIRLPFRHAVVDPTTGAATFRATITNITVDALTADAIANAPDGAWWYYLLRLQVTNGLITEVEEIATATGFPGTDPASLTFPDRIYDTYIPTNLQATRDQLAATADAYWSTVNGQIPWPQAPFHPECQRVEMGTATTNAIFAPGSCGTEFLSPALMGGTVTNRRVYAIDPNYGVVAGLGWFSAVNSTSGTVVFEVFKIQDGLLRHIEATFAFNGQNWSGWGTGRGSSPPS